MHFWWRIASLMLMMLMMMMVMMRKISLSGTYKQILVPIVPGTATCPPGMQDVTTESDCREAAQWFVATYGPSCHVCRFDNTARCPVHGNCHCLVNQRVVGGRQQMVNTHTVFSTIPVVFGRVTNYWRVCRQCWKLFLAALAALYLPCWLTVSQTEWRLWHNHFHDITCSTTKHCLIQFTMPHTRTRKSKISIFLL